MNLFKAVQYVPIVKPLIVWWWIKKQTCWKIWKSQHFNTLVGEAYSYEKRENAEIILTLDADKENTGVKEFYIFKSCKQDFLRNSMPSRCT